MDWASYYPAYIAPKTGPEEPSDHQETRVKRLSKDITVADIGCGFGGLLVALAPKLSDELLIGRLSRSIDYIQHACIDHNIKAWR